MFNFIGILIKIRSYFDKVVLRNLYFVPHLSDLTYCVEVWGNACDTHLDPIIKIQKKYVFELSLSPITWSHATELLFKDFQKISGSENFVNDVINIILLMCQNYGYWSIASLYTIQGEIHEYNTIY